MPTGVFFNAYFLAYLISPRACHSFVGYLEEEAVKTYTHALQVSACVRVCEGGVPQASALGWWGRACLSACVLATDPLACSPTPLLQANPPREP